MCRRLFTLLPAVSLACTAGCIPIPSLPARADGDCDPRGLVGGSGSGRPIRPGATRQQVYDVLGSADARDLVRFADGRTELLRFRMYEGCSQLVLLAVGCSHPGQLKRVDHWYHLLFEFGEDDRLRRTGVVKDDDWPGNNELRTMLGW